MSDKKTMTDAELDELVRDAHDDTAEQAPPTDAELSGFADAYRSATGIEVNLDRLAAGDFDANWHPDRDEIIRGSRRVQKHLESSPVCIACRRVAREAVPELAAGGPKARSRYGLPEDGGGRSIRLKAPLGPQEVQLEVQLSPTSVRLELIGTTRRPQAARVRVRGVDGEMHRAVAQFPTRKYTSRRGRFDREIVNLDRVDRIAVELIDDGGD